MTDDSIDLTPLDDLTPHPDNPRQGDVGAIATSIEQNGWFGTVVAQKSTGHVLAGNHRLQAARQLGIEQVPVYWADVDDTAARRILLADNRTNDLATYDDDILATLLADLASTDDLLGSGWDGDDLDDLLGDLELRADGALDPEAEWTNMPDFDQPDKQSAFHVTIHFPTEKDADRFFAEIDRPKKSSMWWPADDGHIGSSVKKAYISEDN